MEAKLIKNKYGDDFYYLMVGINTYATTHKESFRILSLKNCQAIERGYDLDELALSMFPIVEDWRENSDNADKRIIANQVLQKALEILGDKKFSDKDLLHIWNYSNLYYQGEKEYTFLNAIQSLQQNEWDVIIKMRPASLVYISNLVIEELDADGCLILKRK